jgi:dTDP-glucose 4,6-dehydratase
MSKHVLLTGVGGFIGSHFLEHFLEKTDWTITGIASWRHKGIPERISDSIIYQANKDRVKILTHDLSAPLLVQTKERIGAVDYIVNVASDSHVDRSITDPVPFVLNNTHLILNMLEYAREVRPSAFIQISTDEVYGVAPPGVNFPEWSPTIPSNPYSASKAAQEAIAIGYWRTYGVPIVITSTMNNFGERQDPEKFVPLVIRKVLAGETVTLHAYPGCQVAGSRFYLHARNHADAVLFLLQRNDKPPLYANGFGLPARFNVVGDREVDNLAMAQFIADIVGKELRYTMSDSQLSRPGHDTRYALDGKALRDLGWKAPVDFEDSLEATIRWTLKHPSWLR